MKPEGAQGRPASSLLGGKFWNAISLTSVFSGKQKQR